MSKTYLHLAQCRNIHRLNIVSVANTSISEYSYLRVVSKPVTKIHALFYRLASESSKRDPNTANLDHHRLPLVTSQAGDCRQHILNVSMAPVLAFDSRD